jgi:hypothetical protein
MSSLVPSTEIQAEHKCAPTEEKTEGRHNELLLLYKKMEGKRNTPFLSLLKCKLEIPKNGTIGYRIGCPPYSSHKVLF